MKLEFEVIPQNPFNKHQLAENGVESSAAVEEMLQSGIRHAKDGNRAEARRLLQCVTETEPENETAWMWLASLSEYPEELLVFLNNVLRINSSNERAIEWVAATKSLLAKTFVERGIIASQENRKDAAYRCFTQALMHDNQNELAWLSLASNADSPEEKTEYLQKVLSINPENETAIASLKSVKHEISEQLLKKANFAAISGERETARQLLEEAMQDAPELEEAWILKAYIADDSEEKIACYEKILSLNPENEAAQAGLTSLKMLIQKNSEPRFSVEAIQEILENAQHNELSAVEESNEFSPAFQEAEHFNNFDSNSEINAVENESLDLISDTPAYNPFSNDPSESPTDELDANFIEEIKSQGSFLEAEDINFNSADENQSDSNVFEEQSNQTENQIFEAFNQAENFDKEGFQVFESSDLEQASDSDETEGIFEIEVSDADSLSNIFETENTSEELNFQSENLLFEDSNEAVSTKNDSEFLLETDSAVSPEFSVTEDLPLIEEFPQEAESSVLFEATNSAPEALVEEVPVSNDFAADAKEFTSGSIQIESNGEFSDEQVLVNETKIDEIETHKQNISSTTDVLACPFCFVTNEPQAFVCNSCRTMFSLSDMEMLLSHNEAQPQVLEMVIEDLEAEKASRQLNENELTNLGIAYLNIKNLRKALACLQEAAQLNVNNVVLASKVNFLAIRVSEIEEQESRAEAATFRNLTIMVVDDSATVRKLISGKLEKCGHTVVTAADGREALSQLNEVVPDLILLDIMMPEMDGYQVCKLIRSNEPTKEVPVIMISGKDGFFDKVRGRMAGTSGYITKPFGPETLMRTIETYVA